MEVYKFLPSHFALSALKMRRLKLCMPNSANDLHEFLPFKFMSEECEERFHLEREDFAAEFGLLCFSRGWNEPKMWEGYAERGGGVVLAFEITGGEVVQYVDEFIDLDCKKLSASTFETLVCTKSSKWEHEQEIRVGKAYDRHPHDVEGKCLYFYPFGPDVILKGVLLGEDCTISVDLVEQVIDGLAVRDGVRKVFRDPQTDELRISSYP